MKEEESRGLVMRLARLIQSGHSVTELRARYPEVDAETIAAALHFASRGAGRDPQ